MLGYFLWFLIKILTITQFSSDDENMIDAKSETQLNRTAHILVFCNQNIKRQLSSDSEVLTKIPNVEWEWVIGPFMAMSKNQYQNGRSQFH